MSTHDTHDTGERTPNRLARESSPYLLQHAHNPVDWYPWGEEAFEAARRRDVPIFLSVGYSTCYWCHVMERESFEDDGIAQQMNDNLVSIKLDREQHPEIDDLYMTATQLMTGSGGWPMSVFLEPERLRPFWAGTYFPNRPKQGMPGFAQVIGGMADAWANKREQVLDQAERIADAVREALAERAEPVALTGDHVAAAASALIGQHDTNEGGFGGAPKFPQPVYLRLLQAGRDAAGDDDTRTAIDAVLTRTLDRMAVGGLFDQVGGGFHRYCVDAHWNVPHFEKMLYDNAQLASVYAHAVRTNGDAFHARTLRRTLDYVLGEMTHAEGGFFSAQDAEVRGREGLNYLWTEAEAREVLDDDEAELAVEVYGLGAPNFRDPHHPDDEPKRVPRLDDRPEQVAERLGLDADDLVRRLDSINAKLYERRAQREQPATDDKILAGWNGMMISGFVDGSHALGDPAYLDAAERCAGFLLERMLECDREAGGPVGLVRSWRDGALGGQPVLEDAAGLISALVALHRAGRGAGRYLEEARCIAERTREAYDDSSAGGYFDTPAGRDDLFVRPRSTFDGAVPSGSSLMAHALLDLAQADPEGPWAERAVAQVRSVSSIIAERGVSIAGSAHAALRSMSMGLSDRLAQGKEVPPPTQRPSGFTPVEIFADTDRVRVTPDDPATFNLILRIKAGYHVLAAEPAEEGADVPAGLVPLRVGLVSGSGVAVYADYPEGEPYGAAAEGGSAVGGELRVHTGEVELPVALERAEGVGAGEGTPILGVTYQVCSDTECLEPATVELDMAVDLE